MPKMSSLSPTKQNKLQALISDAIVDCNDREEELMGIATMIQELVDVPCEAKVVGEAVTIVGFQQAYHGMFIEAICTRGRSKYLIELSSVEWTSPYPDGFEWIEAWLRWQALGR
jgi:hypothetical protein